MEETELTNRYFGLVKAFTSVTGIWPFKTGKAQRVKWIISYILFSTAVTTQISRIVVFRDFDSIVEEVPFVCVGLSALVRHVNVVVNRPKFAELLTGVTKDWCSENTDDETAITQTYAETGLLYAFLYRGMLGTICSFFACLPVLPYVMDTIRPLNESRQRLYIYPAYYFVDSDTYYYYILGFTFVGLVAVASVMMGTDMIMIYLVQHACGLLITAGYRLKHVVDAVGVSSKGCVSLSDTQYRKLCSTVWNHNKAIQIIRDIESVYAVSMFFQVGVVMVAFSITLVMVAVRELGIDLCLYYLFIVAQFIHILFLTIQGQFVINSHDVVYHMIYEARWYEQSPKAQALYVLALRRCLTPPMLTAGGLIPLNLNSFAEIVKASVSYFTVLKSN